MKETDFIIIDTEGRYNLSEVALLNSQGELIYEAFVAGHPNNQEIKLRLDDLATIITQILTITQGKTLVCHYAEHDIELLKNSCQRVHLSWTEVPFCCTLQLAKTYFPKLKSYSLEYLCQHFGLQVNRKYFYQDFAHTARYDAQFTYQLYLKIMEQQFLQSLQANPNPFSENRVDTPFQTHLDVSAIYGGEFAMLEAIIADIKRDTANHQSKGVLIIGEAGSGKTHLMMRLAKKLMEHNRLLFIRQPNNPEAVLYHIYSRILESFVEIVPSSGHSQLEHLLAKSFSKIQIEAIEKKKNPTRKDEAILTLLTENHLNLYHQKLGSEDSDTKRRNWQTIEKAIIAWWQDVYGFSGYAPAIVKGLVKFCSYADPIKRSLIRNWLAANELPPAELESIGLENWSAELSREEFSLEAIAVFGKLSIIDEPLIIIFDQLEGLKDKTSLLQAFGESIKEIFTYTANSLIIFNLFPDRWLDFRRFFDASVVDRMSQHQIQLQKPASDLLQQLLVAKAKEQGLELEQLFTAQELEKILAQPAIRSVINRAADYYRYKVNQVPLPDTLLLSSESSKEFEQETREAIAILQAEIALLKEKMGITATVVNLTSIPEELKKQVETYLEQQRKELAENYAKPAIISDSDDIGKLRTLIEAFKSIKTIEIDCLRLGRKKLPEHLLVKVTHQERTESFAIGFLQASGLQFTTRIKNFNELVIHHQEVRFGLFRDSRANAVTEKTGKEEVKKLRSAKNGNFLVMEREDRLTFEVIYQLVIDIQNRDLAVHLASALQVVESRFQTYWLMGMLNLKPKQGQMA